MKKINFLFGIHNHQPVGNFEHVLEDAYQKAYKPFFEVFEKYHLKMTVHFSGWLLEWLSKKHPEYIERLKHLVREGRLEIATGGYYEPIIPVIPEEDRIEQIRRLTQLIEELFDTDPAGMWLAERVWEPSIAKSLVKAGVKYVVVDDNHFHWAGLYDEQLDGYYVTEEDGYALNVFPISKRLRYLIPFEPPSSTVNHLLLYANSGGTALQVMFDDGEKFGVWPQTYTHVYEKGWLEEFFQTIENTDWIESLTFKEYLEHYPPKGRIYLPISSYLEMTEWALPSKARKEFEELLEDLRKRGEFEKFSMFLKGGIWRSFLSKYTESNNMHKKMLKVRRMIEESGNPPEEARKRYLMSQSNDAYWHGVFGGLYLPHLRDAVYTNLINAESLLDLPERIEEEDVDCDGFKEILVSSKNLNLYFDPHYGGRLFE
ncbi:MAG TPA: 4-alpha-glucanotransferase, partial [Thermotogae bacterium]|nr:4-alpha-glucanotransferase [Thermotogota bacterium]